MVVAAIEEKTKCRESTRAKAHGCRTFEHKGPAQALHAVAGAQYLPTAGWQ